MISVVIYFTSGLKMDTVCSKEEAEKMKFLLHSPSKKGKVITIKELDTVKTIVICLESIVAAVFEESLEDE